MSLPTILSGNVASATASTGFVVANSCRFDSGDSPHMAKNQGTPSSTRIYTFSFWFKIGGVDAGDRTMFSYGADSDSQFILMEYKKPVYKLLIIQLKILMFLELQVVKKLVLGAE